MSAVVAAWGIDDGVGLTKKFLNWQRSEPFSNDLIFEPQKNGFMSARLSR